MVFKCWCQLYHCSPMSCTGLKICVLTVLPMKWVSNDRNVSDGRYLQANNNTQKKDSSTRFLKSGPMLHVLSRRRAVALPGNQQRKVPGKTKQNKKKKQWNSSILTKEDSQLRIEKLCAGRYLLNHLHFLFLQRTKKC